MRIVWSGQDSGKFSRFVASIGAIEKPLRMTDKSAFETGMKWRNVAAMSHENQNVNHLMITVSFTDNDELLWNTMTQVVVVFLLETSWETASI